MKNKLIREYKARLKLLVIFYKLGSKYAHEQLNNLITDIKLSLTDKIPQLNDVVAGYNTYLDCSAAAIIMLLNHYLMETIENNQHHYSKAKCALGTILLFFGLCLIGLSVAALLPPLSQCVTPFFDWIHSSSVIESASNDGIIGILVTLGLALVSCGGCIVKNAYTD